MNWSLAIPFALGSIAGLLVGRRMVSHFSGPRIQQAFAVFALLIAIMMLIRLVM
jgi:uncharacterized membrane protein YfcA